MTRFSFDLASGSLRRRLMAGVLVVPAAIALAGCAKQAIDPTMTASIAKPVSEADYAQAAAYWGPRYDQSKGADRDTALNYAIALQRSGHIDQALGVLQSATLKFPDDRSVLAAYGKALAANGDLQLALTTIQQAQTPDHPDWRLMSAQAAILDQTGRNDDARKLYAQALALAPNEPTILSNYGMSYVMTGELTQAEKLLRQAIAAPGADSRVRQNLALVVGLQGRFDEAQKIASADLSPDQAAANVAYLKQMLAQQNNWQTLKAGKATG